MPIKSFSSIDAVTTALCRVLQSKLPKGTEVTALAPSEDGKPKEAHHAPGRLNVFLFRISRNAAFRNPLKPLAGPGERATVPQILADLHYLVTAHGASGGAEGSANHLLELALAAVTEKPILPPADLATEGNPTPTSAAEILVEEFTFEEVTRLWAALRTELQVSIALLVRNVVL